MPHPCGLFRVRFDVLYQLTNFLLLVSKSSIGYLSFGFGTRRFIDRGVLLAHPVLFHRFKYDPIVRFPISRAMSTAPPVSRARQSHHRKQHQKEICTTQYNLRCEGHRSLRWRR